jgi:Sulfotransferase family
MLGRRKQRRLGGEKEAGEKALEPILVDYFTRDGSTLMMRLLATSPQIVIGGQYPYEHKYFAYLYRWARLLERREWPNRFWGQHHLASISQEEGMPFLGPPPWPRELFEPTARGEETISEYTFRTVWQEFSRRAIAHARKRRGARTADVRFYAEKHMTTWRVNLDDLPPVRLVALLRDPRDTYVSITAFRKKRREEGTLKDSAMGRRPGESREAWLDRHLERQKERLNWIIEALRDETMPVIRYEDLVLDLPGQARRLEEWLGVDLDPALVTRDVGMRSKHVSAETPESSIGRWEREMPPALATRFNDELGEEMKELGFDVPSQLPSRPPPAKVSESPAQSA